MTTAGMNQARVDFRTTPEIKSLIEQAAAICGMTVSEYIKAIVVEKALQVISQNETRLLSDRDRDVFLSLLDSPAAPNETLRAAAAEFKNAVKDKALDSLMPIQIERLTRAHDRNAFDCGESPLNNYLQRFALQNDERGIGRTFVAVEAGDTRILGYYTLATGKVTFENVPNNKKLPPRMPIPVVLLGRLAVDNDRKDSGLGRLLLMHALWRSQQIATHVGVYAVEVDALHEQAAQFYLKFGFTPLLDDPLHLYLSMKDIKALSFDFDEVEEGK